MFIRRPGMLAAIASGGGVIWTPAALGASLLAWWDANRSDLITQSSNKVSSWLDIVGGYNVVQATDANRPVYSATSFNGYPGLTGNGTSQYLRLATVPAGIPTGANPSELWVLVDQTALVADATTRIAFGYGNLSSTYRTVQRAVISGANRAQATIGSGAGSSNAANSSVDFSGRHVVRLIVSATASQPDVDAIAGSSASIVPGTASNFLTLFATPAAVNWWQGVIAAVLVTAPLSASEAVQMYAYLNRRL